MSNLVSSKLLIFFVMAAGGIAAGLCMEVFRLFIKVRKLKGIREKAAEILSYAMAGVLAGEFSYFCDNGKITLTGTASFLIALWLWKRLFCGILTLTEAENGEEERRSKHV